MPKTTKKVVKKSVKKVARVKKVSTPRVVTPKQTSTFSQEFTNALLVIFGAGMVLFAYVILRLYG